MTDTIEQLAGMNLEDAIRTRRSVRGYLDKQVPRDILEKVFEIAQWAPSNCNAQPWQVYVASGETRNRLRQTFIDNVMNGVPPNSDFHYQNKFEGINRRRQVDCAIALYNSMGIGKEDKAGRARAGLRNFELFDAPHVAFIGMHRDFKETVAVDVGMYAQTLMLTMTSYGISSCAQGSMRNYPDVIREAFDVPKDIRILFGISFGYEDAEVPANNARTTRAPLSENIAFLD